VVMSLRRPGVDWRKAARQLDAEVQRVTGLLRSVRHPSAPAIGHWSVAEVAMHLSQAWMVVPGLARQDLREIEELLPRFQSTRSLLGDIWELEGVTADGVRADPERDPAVLASRIEERARRYLGALQGAATDRRPWLVEGTEVALVTLTCHLLNETIMHGWDIARGDGRSWDIKAAHAATVLEGFLVPAIQALGPRDMVDQVSAAGLQATFEVRLRGAGRHHFIFDDGALTIEAASSRPVDCVIEAEPAALLLVAWNRLDQAQAIVERKLVPSGPKAWLAPRFRSLMRNP
jgi:hypothetical protein